MSVAVLILVGRRKSLPGALGILFLILVIVVLICALRINNSLHKGDVSALEDELDKAKARNSELVTTHQETVAMMKV